jgi:hypothetical protein
MSCAGSAAPALSAATRGSFHFVTLPRKMSASTSPVRLSEARPGTLYVTATAPSTVGMCSTRPPLAFASSASLIGASLAPKSTVCSESWRMPPPEPIDW